MTSSFPLSPLGERVRVRGSAASLVLLFSAVAGCSRDVNLLPGRMDGGGGGNDSIVINDTGINDTGGTNPACSGLGDPIRLPTAAGPTCAATLETRGHRFALCACDPMTAAARIRSGSYDSRDLAPMVEERDAAFGFNSSLNANAEMRAGGAFYVAGTGGLIALNAPIRSAASLRVGGPLSMSGDQADIGRDAYVSGNVTGDVRVSGMLHAPATATIDSQVRADGGVVREAVTIAPPCDCSAGAAGFVDIAGAIAAAAGHNDNAAINLSPTALAAGSAPTAPLALPCGTFYLNDIDADAAVTLAVHGRTLLAVGGDVQLNGGLTIQLDASAELDLLVSRRLTVSGGATFGAINAAARFRVWVAGTDSVTFDGAPYVHAVVHAPSAPVWAPAGLPLSGSLLARGVSIGADTMINFDRAIYAAGAVCGEPDAAPVP